MEYKRIPIKITIERPNDIRNNIKTKIDYGYEKKSEDSDDDEYDGIGNIDGPVPMFAEDLKITLRKHLENPLTAKQCILTEIQQGLYRAFMPKEIFNDFKEKLCNLFVPESKFLQPQLKNIVTSVPFPTQNITADRWNRIINKLTEENLVELYGNAYAYANGMSYALHNALISNGKNVAWSDVTIPLP